MKPRKLREILASNVKKERKKLGLTQEKLAEIADLSTQTINDIEGCRMWVSDKTITKLALVLRVEVYQLLIPVVPDNTLKTETDHCDNLLGNLEEKIIRNIRQQFWEVNELSRDKSLKD